MAEKSLFACHQSATSCVNTLPEEYRENGICIIRQRRTLNQQDGKQCNKCRRESNGAGGCTLCFALTLQDMQVNDGGDGKSYPPKIAYRDEHSQEQPIV